MSDGTIAAGMRMDRRRVYVVLFAVGLAGFGAVAGKRLARQSTDPHFVLQADAWLHGRASIAEWKDGADDPAKVEVVELKDGRTVRGRRYQSIQRATGVEWRGAASRLRWTPLFRAFGGEEIPVDEIARTVGFENHVSFPPFPAVLMLPQAAIHGRIANDVFPTVLLAALALPLAFAVFRRLSAAGLSSRTATDDVWLTIALGFGTVFFFSAVQGRVWYTAHVVGVVLALGYVWSSVEARHPLLAGLCLGLAAVTRTPMAFMFPLFLLEAWRTSGRSDRRAWIRCCALFCAPVVAIAVVAMIYNRARFGEPLEFGHIYLAVRQQDNIETWGMFSSHYLSRNLAVALALLPELSTTAPFVKINGHGLALWFTTPLLLFLAWPRQRGVWHRPLWLTAIAVAVPSLLYMNSGWLQFGCRFSLDYVVFLFALLAVGGRPLGRTAKALIIVAIAINLFGAITFARYNQFYDNDSYGTVIAH